MKHLRLAAWTFWFTLSWIALAHAGPVGAAISALGGFFGTAVGKIVLGIALNVGASLLQKALAKKPEQPGIRSNVEVGGNNPLSFVVGSYATPGSADYVGTWGDSGKTPNAYLTQVVTLSDLPVTSVEPRIWINGEKCTISGTLADGRGWPVVEFHQNNFDYLWVRHHNLGAQTSPDALLIDKFGNDPDRPWLPDMIGRGVAMAILTARLSRELFTAAPQAIYEVRGIRLYDPRKDSTVGGSGPHRWGQPATYEFSDNPVVIIYNILRGIYYEGQWVYGPKVPASRLPLANWFAAMNECDVSIPLSGGGTERQFRCGYEIRTAEEPADVIEKLLAGCNGRMAEIGGTYKIHVGAPGLPVYFFTDEDIVVTEGQTFEPFPGYENTFNGAAASYPEPTAAWQMKDAPQYRSATFEAEDGGEIRLASLTLDTVPFPLQVQRLMRSVTNDNRRFRRHQHTLPPEAWLFEPLDTFAWSSARNGYDAKHFLVNEMEDLDNVNQAIALLEVDPSDYDWSPSFELPWSVGSLTPEWPPSQPMTGWQVQPAIFYDAEGKERRPSIEVFFDGDQDDVRAVRVQVRLAEDGSGVFDGELPYGDPNTNPSPKSVILNGTFLPNEAYEVRGRYVPFSGRATSWSFWLPVTTPNVLLGPDDVDFGDISEFIGEATEWIGWNARETIEQALANFEMDITDEESTYRDMQRVRREAASTFERSRAEWSGDILLATGPNSALAQRLELLEVTLEEDIAQAVNLLQTEIAEVDGRVTANAQSIQLLTTEVDDIASSVTVRGQAMASPGGGWARWGVEVKTGSGDDWSSAAFFIDAQPGMSRVAFVADQFVITDGNNQTVPFVFQGGTAYLENARIGDLRFDRLRSNNGKLDIRGDGSNASIEIFN